MTPDELAESALVIQWQLAHEARETAAVMTTSSSVTREETSGKAGKRPQARTGRPTMSGSP